MALRVDHQGTTVAAAFVLVALGCHKGEEVCAVPSSGSGAMARGDVNADGRADLADGMFLARYAHMGGPAPVCDDVADIVDDGRTDLGDGFPIWSAVYAGVSALPEPAEVTCADAAPPADPACGRVDLSLDLPRKVEGTAGTEVTIDGTVALRVLDLPVEGWAVRVEAEGCRLTEATTEGTLGADTIHGGLRRSGYDHTAVGADGDWAASAVVLDWRRETTLPEGKDDHALLSLTLRAVAPESGCDDCTIRLADGDAGGKGDFTNLLSAEGRAYVPTLPEETVRVCGK